MRNALRKLIAIITVVLFLAGCAYGNHMGKGDELYAAGDYENALRQYEAALQLEPDSKDAAMKVELTKRKLVEAYRVEAEQKLEAGDYYGALMAAHRAHQELPNGKGTRDVVDAVSEATFARADAFLKTGDFANATYLYDTMSELLPPVADLAYERSRQAKTDWAILLVRRADESERAGRPADAMLLVGKAAQLTRDATLEGRRDRLRRQLISEWTYLVSLEGKGDKGFAHAVAQNLRGGTRGTLLIVDREDMGGRTPHATGTLSMTPPKYRRESSTRIATAQYQSGTRQVDNPFYASRVSDLQREERELIDRENDVMRYENDVTRYQQAVASEGSTPNVTTGAEQSLSRATSDLEYARGRLADQRYEVQRAREAVRAEPQFKDEPVYSTLEYPITTTTVFGDANLAGNIRHEDNRLRVDLGTRLTVSASDEEHGSYPIAGITADPLTLPGEHALNEAIFQKAVAHVGEAALTSFDGWRETIFQRGQRASTDDQRVEWFMIYILTDPERVKPEAASTIASLRGVPDPARVASGE